MKVIINGESQETNQIIVEVERNRIIVIEDGTTLTFKENENDEGLLVDVDDMFG